MNVSISGLKSLPRQVKFLLTLLCACAGAQAQTTSHWNTHNRYLEAGIGRHQQDYHEQDTTGLATNCVLDTETGDQDSIQLALRWQSLNGIFANLAFLRQSGTTSYDGYLQNNNGSLTPYRALSGNVAAQMRLQLGYALNTQTWALVPANWQFIPVVELGQNQWQRNLVQYSETYRFNAYALGGIAQWKVRPGTVLEAQAFAGPTQVAKVSASILGFEDTVPSLLTIFLLENCHELEHRLKPHSMKAHLLFGC